MGEEENSSLFFFLALHSRSPPLASLADVFEKNEKKNKITSVYRLLDKRRYISCREGVYKITYGIGKQEGKRSGRKV